jgi:hypothetical protein
MLKRLKELKRFKEVEGGVEKLRVVELDSRRLGRG